MRVMLGGQNVQVRVTTTEVSGLQAQAAAEAALVTIAADKAAAEAAADSAAADAVATAADRVQTGLDRTQTGIYSAASNTTGFYANTAAGLAATSSGQYFSVISTSTDGYLAYLNSGGSAVLQQTLPSVSYFAKNQQVIRLQYVASGSTTNNPIFKPVEPWVVLAGTMYGREFVVDEWPADNITGSEGITLQQYDGTAFITGLQFKMPDGSNIETGYLEEGKSVRFRRDATSTVFEVILPPDPVTTPLSKAISGVGYEGFNPSILRPVQMTKVGPYTWQVRVYPHDNHYENGVTDRCQTDFHEYFLVDMGAFQADTFAPALNSIYAQRLDHPYRFANHRFFDLIGGIITDTGHVPSTFEAVSMTGNFADAGNSTNYQLSGIGHGHMEAVSWTLYGTTNDASTSNVDVQSSDLKDAAIGTTFFGKKVVSTFVAYDETPTGDRAAKRTMTMTFESAATHTCKVNVVLDGTDAGVEVGYGVRVGGYVCMLPIRNATRARALKVNPATGEVTQYGPIVQCNLQDDSQTDLTTDLSGSADEDWNALEMWDHRQTIGRQIARVRLVNNAGAGFTHWVGAVVDANRVARTAPWFIANETWGTKGYDPWYSDVTTKEDLSASVLTAESGYLIVFGDDPEAA